MKCLVKGCGKQPHCRGLCASCYGAALVKVNTKQATWADLVELGLAQPASKRGPRGKFGKQFELAVAGKN